jgi:hypothetical protein
MESQPHVCGSNLLNPRNVGSFGFEREDPWGNALAVQRALLQLPHHAVCIVHNSGRFQICGKPNRALKYGKQEFHAD